MAKPTDPLEPSPASPGERARTATQLKRWIHDFTGLHIPDCPVCPDHQSPWEIFEAIHLDRPSIALILGSRGSGKSFLSALDTHLTSRWDPNHGTRILGGSKHQSAQIYEALRSIATDHEGKVGNDAAALNRLHKDRAIYVNGSKVEILAASNTSVRGPHVPSLKLDEVDEMATDIRESAMGMCMGRIKRRDEARDAVTASVIMTSTCHRVNGPMAHLIQRANEGDFPLFTMCVFEVLERCPETRSGANNEKCPDCPLFRYCHDVPEGMSPKAKRSDGHYPIESLIQKQKTTSARVFEADYLCKLSSSEAAWFPSFDPKEHVSEYAEYDPAYKAHLAVDSGVFTGAVFFQIVPVDVGDGPKVDQVRVFADYLAEGVAAEKNGQEIMKLAELRCGNRLESRTTDPAGNSRTAIGPTVMGEYQRAKLFMESWPQSRVTDSLALLESFITPADKTTPQFLIHPRCVATINALQCYRRAKKDGQLLDMPADPQHPYEDLVDALRGGLKSRYPNGRNFKPINMHRVSARRIV